MRFAPPNARSARGGGGKSAPQHAVAIPQGRYGPPLATMSACETAKLPATT